MIYFYQANGNFIKDNILESFDEIPLKIPLKKYLLNMQSDGNRLTKLIEKLSSIENNVTNEINKIKDYLPFTYQESKLITFKSDEWRKDYKKKHVFYIDMEYDVKNEPQIFTQIMNKKKSDLKYYLDIKNMKKQRKYRFSLELLNYDYDKYNKGNFDEESILKDLYLLNVLLIG